MRGANIDIIIEETIQRLINDKFAVAKVITFAHRLNIIINSDRVLVHDKGNVVEFDTPTPKFVLKFNFEVARMNFEAFYD